MCSIFGMIGYSNPDVKVTTDDLSRLVRLSQQRGRDGIAMELTSKFGVHRFHDAKHLSAMLPPSVYWNVIGNCRAEPTTEYLETKRDYDQQPYRVGDWNIVHNGTIANDVPLRTGEHPTKIDSAAIVEQLALLQKESFDTCWQVFYQMVKRLQGSYAIAATHKANPHCVYIACNYRPIYYTRSNGSFMFASEKSFLPDGDIRQVPPYSIGSIDVQRGEAHIVDIPRKVNKKCLVVCSGGLDSVTVAAKCVEDGYDVSLIHFQYGCRAEKHEEEAVTKVAHELGTPLIKFPMPIYSKDDSPLLQADTAIAGGEEGAEFAHEWVPARNLVMLSIATAYAEANDFSFIALGNNLEEAGAYPDNEFDFFTKFNDLLDNAVGDGKRVQILQPVGHLMKHEIVKLALQINAPLQHTWSCYKHGKLHCGKCGPCYMRKTAFQINKATEVIKYETDSE